MTQVSRDDIVRLAMLSNLQLADDEVEGLRADIDGILRYVEQLDELDTSGVTPAYQVTGLRNVYRQDVVEQGSVGRTELLALSPEQTADQIKVPKVI